MAEAVKFWKDVKHLNHIVHRAYDYRKTRDGFKLERAKRQKARMRITRMFRAKKLRDIVDQRIALRKREAKE